MTNPYRSPSTEVILTEPSLFVWTKRIISVLFLFFCFFLFVDASETFQSHQLYGSPNDSVALYAMTKLVLISTICIFLILTYFWSKWFSLPLLVCVTIWIFFLLHFYSHVSTDAFLDDTLWISILSVWITLNKYLNIFNRLLLKL